MSDTEHQEKHFEAYIVQQLAARNWLVGDSADYDQNHAIYPEDLVQWVKSTQAKRWEKLVAGTLLNRLQHGLDLVQFVRL